MVAIRQGQEPQSSCPSWTLPLVLGSGGGDWKDKGNGGDGGVGSSSSSTGTGPGADSPEGAPWAAWLCSPAWDWGGAWLWLWVCWRMFRHSPRQLSVAADVALSSSRSWSKQERGPLVGRESMDWTRFFCWPSAWDITWGTKVMYTIKIHSEQSHYSNYRWATDVKKIDQRFSHYMVSVTQRKRHGCKCILDGSSNLNSQPTLPDNFLHHNATLKTILVTR